MEFQMWVLRYEVSRRNLEIDVREINRLVRPIPVPANQASELTNQKIGTFRVRQQVIHVLSIAAFIADGLDQFSPNYVLLIRLCNQVLQAA